MATAARPDAPETSQANNQPFQQSASPNDDPLSQRPQGPTHQPTQPSSDLSPPSSTRIPQAFSTPSDNPSQPSSGPTNRVTEPKTNADIEQNAAVGNTQSSVPNEQAQDPSNSNTPLNPSIVNSAWVLFGICCMLAGILIVHQFLLPKIYVCPAGATCQHNLDLNDSIVTHLQSLMQYWFQAGLWLSGMGLTKFISYSTRFVLKRQKECRIGTVETSVLALQGSWSNALLQLTLMQKAIALFLRTFQKLPKGSPQLWIQKGTSLLGILALLQFGIGLIVSFVISSSIDLQGGINVHVPFQYPDSFNLPHLDSRVFTDEELAIAYQMSTWLSSPSRSLYPRTVFNGTLVNRDNRTIKPTSPSPTGFHITGDLVACGPQGWSVSTLPTNSSYFSDGHGGDLTGVKAYNFSNDAFSFYNVGYSYTTLASQFLGSSEMDGSITSRQYLWASNSSTAIPNATASHDGGIYFAVCNHTSYMASLPTLGGSADAQIILPSQPIVYSDPNDPNVYICPSNDPFSCVSWTVENVVLAWWQLYVVAGDLIPFSCVNGLLAAFGGQSDTTNCSLTQERWANTLSTALDSLISIAPTSGNATQYLWVSTEAINPRRWWIQGVLPGLILILYLLCGAYNWYLSNGGKDELKELDYIELLCDKSLVSEPVDDIRQTVVSVH